MFASPQNVFSGQVGSGNLDMATGEGRAMFFTYETINSSMTPVLYVTDGSISNTVRVNSGNLVGGKIYYQGAFYFSGSALGLWKSDGTVTGTVEISANLQNAQNFAVLPTALLFTVNNSLYATDGTDAGTRLLRTFGGGFVNAWNNFVVEGGAAYLFADDGGGAGVEVWRTDGTVSGTVALTNLSDNSVALNPTGFAGVVSNSVTFMASRPPDYGLWAINNSASGAVLLQQFMMVSQPFVKTAGYIYFPGQTSFSPGGYMGLWRTNGTNAGTTAVLDSFGGTNSVPTLASIANGSYRNAAMAALRSGKLVFSGLHAPDGNELWSTHGTTSTTVYLKDILPGNGSSTPDLVAVGDWVIVSADEGVDGRALWLTDGTVTNTRRLLDLEPGPEAAYIGQMRYTQGMFYVSGSGNTTPETLWAWRLSPSIEGDLPQVTVLVGEPFTYAFTGTGVLTPTFSVVSGTLPPGLTLTSAGLITGTPTAPGHYGQIVIELSNGFDPAAVRQLSFTVHYAAVSVYLPIALR